MSDYVYKLQINLIGLEDAVWRIVEVPATISLDRLHDVIQIAMGWSDSHIHLFKHGKNNYSDAGVISKLMGDEHLDILEEGAHRLNSILKRKNDSLLYIYDFDDTWAHEVKFLGKRKEKIEDDDDYEDEYIPCFEDLIFHPICIDGAGSTPFDGVGGVDGYFDFCETMKDPKHEYYQNALDWYRDITGLEEFSLRTFGIDFVNFQLDNYLRWSKDRLLDWI